MNLPIDMIRMDGGTQPRSSLNEGVIADYAEAMKAGTQFPDVVVFFDGETYWLSDGFHRVKSTRLAGLDVVRADVRQGTRRDAVLYSVGANAAHGLRRSIEDKRRAVRRLCEDEEWQDRSIKWMASTAKVNRSMVKRIIETEYPRLQEREVIIGRDGILQPTKQVHEHAPIYVGAEQHPHYIPPPPNIPPQYKGLNLETLTPLQQKQLAGEELTPDESDQLSKELGFLTEDDLSPEELVEVEQEAKLLAEKYKSMSPPVQQPPAPHRPIHPTPVVEEEEPGDEMERGTITITLRIPWEGFDSELAAGKRAELDSIIKRWLYEGNYTGYNPELPNGIELDDIEINYPKSWT